MNINFIFLCRFSFFFFELIQRKLLIGLDVSMRTRRILHILFWAKANHQTSKTCPLTTNLTEYARGEA